MVSADQADELSQLRKMRDVSLLEGTTLLLLIGTACQNASLRKVGVVSCAEQWECFVDGRGVGSLDRYLSPDQPYIRFLIQSFA
jgi:hypothetical protein